MVQVQLKMLDEYSTSLASGEGSIALPCPNEVQLILKDRVPDSCEEFSRLDMGHRRHAVLREVLSVALVITH
jgi:hypothetical protein